MTLMRRYLLRTFALHFAVALVGLTALLLTVDLLKAAEDLVPLGVGGVAGVSRYAWLRLPSVMSFAVPLATLLASFLTLWRFAASSEMAAMRAVGVSVRSLVGALCAAAVLAGGLDFALDTAGVQSERNLAVWMADLAANAPGSQTEGAPAVWLTAPPWVISIGAASEDGESITDLRLIRRAGGGGLAETIKAARALFTPGGGWLLQQVVRAARQPNGRFVVTHERSAAWHGDLSPRHVRETGRPPNLMTLSGLARMSRAGPDGPFPRTLYRVWLDKRIAGPFANLALALLAAPAAFGAARRGRLGGVAAQVLGLGFAFFVFDGFAFNLGAGGAIPSALAAWAPIIAFACIGLYRLLRLEEG